MCVYVSALSCVHLNDHMIPTVYIHTGSPSDVHNRNVYIILSHTTSVHTCVHYLLYHVHTTLLVCTKPAGYAYIVYTRQLGGRDTIGR